jgi:hypothetical protein
VNRRTLIGLVVALVVLTALAVAVSLSQRQPTGAGELLLPQLKSQLNDISKIVVLTGGNKTAATLERRQDQWVVAERSGYPADLGRIRTNLIALAEARIVEEKTSSPEFYSKLGVDDIDKETATGVKLDIAVGDQTIGVIIGQTGVAGGDRAYARLAGEAKSWMISGKFNLAREAADWLDRNILNVASSRVQAVTITHPEGSPVRIEKPSREAVNFDVKDVPKGRELSFETVGNAIGGALTDLTLDNVAPAAEFKPGDVKPVVTRFETFDGLIVEATSWKTADGPRFKFAARADQALAERFATQPAAGKSPDTKATPDKPADAQAAANERTESGNDSKDKKPTLDEVKVEADQINARLSPWVYTLADFKAEQFTKKLDDLLQPKPPSK